MESQLQKKTLLQTQRDVLKNHSQANTPQALGDFGQRVDIDSAQGDGYFDFHFFDQVLLGRADCHMHQETEMFNKGGVHSYGMQMMLSGRCQFLQENGQMLAPKAPEIWLIKGNLGAHTVCLPAKERVRNILINFAPSFIESIGKQARPNSVCARLVNSKSPSLIKLPNVCAETINLAWQLYDYPSATNQMELMALQGAALSFMSHLLNSEQLTSELQPTYEHAANAQALLDKHYQQYWSIRELAKAVATNECALKREFKQLTGSTINQYQRTLRMDAAMKLLQASDGSLAHIAERIGYASKDYFVRVFKKHYGFHPKDIKI